MVVNHLLFLDILTNSILTNSWFYNYWIPNNLLYIIDQYKYMDITASTQHFHSSVPLHAMEL